MTALQRANRIWPPVATLAVVLAALEIAVRAGWIASFLVPRPTDAAKSLAANASEIFEAFNSTAAAAGIGFLLSTSVGLLIAVLLSSGVWVRRALYPYAVFFQTVPIIAIAPLLVIWFGFGQGAVIASAFVASVFPVIANTLAGLLSVDPPLVDLFHLYRANRIAMLLKLRLPFALPQVFTGLRVARGWPSLGQLLASSLPAAGWAG